LSQTLDESFEKKDPTVVLVVKNLKQPEFTHEIIYLK